MNKESKLYAIKALAHSKGFELWQEFRISDRSDRSGIIYCFTDEGLFSRSNNSYEWSESILTVQNFLALNFIPCPPPIDWSKMAQKYKLPWRQPFSLYIGNTTYMYKVDEDGLQCSENGGGTFKLMLIEQQSWYVDGEFQGLENIVMALCKSVPNVLKEARPCRAFKSSWVPKKGELYFYPAFNAAEGVLERKWYGDVLDENIQRIVGCYESQMDARLKGEQLWETV